MASFASDYRQINHLRDPGMNAARSYAGEETADGETLADILNSVPIANSRLVDLAVRAGANLAAEHAAGNVHGGITADQIILTRDGGVRFMNFGMRQASSVEEDQLAVSRIFQAALCRVPDSVDTKLDALQASRARQSFLAVPLTLCLFVVVAFYFLTHSTLPKRSQAEIHSVPVWSPDRQRILFVKPVSGVDQIFLQSAGSPSSIQITHASRSSLNPHWSPDGRSIAFQRGTRWWCGAAEPDQQKPQQGFHRGACFWKVAPAGCSGRRALLTGILLPGRVIFARSVWRAKRV